MRAIGGRLLVIVAALALVTAGGLATAGSRVARPAPRPNVVVVLTDDQSAESIRSDPPAMPFLQARLADPSDHWITFPNAFVSTPMCCPSRVSLLTGLFSHHTGVLTNQDGSSFDDSSTLATWLHGAGYATGLVGKYLNGYPFGRGPFVPPGWDRWTAKMQGGPETVYTNYTLVEQDLGVRHGAAPGDYLTDVLADRAVAFVERAPADRPFFLLFAPTAPHYPWTSAPRHAGAVGRFEVSEPPSVAEADVSDKPAWVRALPPPSPGERALLAERRRMEYASLLAVDGAVRRILEAVAARGELDRTALFFLTDNGAAFGEHRWQLKSCPYAACTGTPFLVRLPGARPREEPAVVSNVDVAPTIAELAGVVPPGPLDGESLLQVLDGAGRPGVFMEWAGGNGVPAWRAVRTLDFLYVELVTGERELYDLTGRLGSADPYELENLSGAPSASTAERRLAFLLARLSAG